MSETNGSNGDAKMIYGQYEMFFSFFYSKFYPNCHSFLVSSPRVSFSQVAQCAADWP